MLSCVETGFGDTLNLNAALPLIFFSVALITESKALDSLGSALPCTVTAKSVGIVPLGPTIRLRLIVSLRLLYATVVMPRTVATLKSEALKAPVGVCCHLNTAKE